MPSDGAGRHVRGLSHHTKVFSLMIYSTAICCTVRTALSGSITNPDLTCKSLQSLNRVLDKADSTRGRHHKRRLETVSQTIQTYQTPEPKLIPPRPEVNIGIVCANAPVIRPLYLFFRGRLASQIRSNSKGVSKESMWPSNTPGAAMSPAWEDGSNDNSMGDTSVSLEMGLRPLENAQPQSPLREKPYFIMGSGR